jgi:NTP pyrophosphatase (non-canonical NTP hydrolase)
VTDPTPLDDLQTLVSLSADRLWPGQTVEESGLALAEEAGEVCRALLKRQHGVRGTRSEWDENLRIEIAQVAGVCLHIANQEGWSLFEALREMAGVLSSRAKEERSE